MEIQLNKIIILLVDGDAGMSVYFGTWTLRHLWYPKGIFVSEAENYFEVQRSIL